MPTIKRIMLPTGFSDLSKKAAPYADQMAQWSGAELHVVHVVPDAQVFVDPTIPGAGIPMVAPLTDDMRAAATTSLDKFIQETLPHVHDRVKKVILFGQITDEIVRYAETEAIDLIIMGTHADGMLKRIVWGSIGKSVLDRVPCPVLLAPVRGAHRT
jgi:universal stress protein A